MKSLLPIALAIAVAFGAGCAPLKPSRTSPSPSSTPKQAPQKFDVKTAFYKSPKDVERILGESSGGHKLKADASNRGRTPGELREYSAGKHWQYALARFYKGRCVSIQLELLESFERPDDALKSVGLDVSKFLDFAEEAPLATRWRAKKLGNYLFKDISAFRTKVDAKFNIVQFELVDPD